MRSTNAAPEFPGREPTERAWVPLASMFADPAYQRPVDGARVKRIAENLDPDAIGFPFVSERAGRGKPRYAVIDGEHRRQAALIVLGADQMLECEVIRGISVEREAQLFRERNDSVKLKAIHRFLAGVTAGSEEEVAINKIVESVGLKIDPSRGDRVVQGVRALVRIYRGDRGLGSGKNALILKRTLLILDESWGPNADAYQADLIRGVGLFLTRRGDIIDTEELIRKLKGFSGGPVRLIGDARGLRSMNGGGEIGHAVAEIVTRVFNKGKSKGKVPSWREKEEE